jgi:hypothetical protein
MGLPSENTMDRIYTNQLIDNLDVTTQQLMVEFPGHAAYIKLQRAWSESGGTIIRIGAFFAATEAASSGAVHEVVCCDMVECLSLNRPKNVRLKKVIFNTAAPEDVPPRFRRTTHALC